MKVFIVPGYHLPRDIASDGVYINYFNFVCEKIKKISGSDRVMVILSGGNIDMDKPYDRVLSKEMKGLFLKISEDFNLNCLILTEEKSLSSLENLIYSKNIIDNITGEKQVYIFSDLQRSVRTKLTADKIFNNYGLLTIDLSSNEEKQNQDTVNKKGKIATDFSLWAIKSKENMEEFMKIYAEKFSLLRSVPEDKRKETEILWWKSMISKYQDKLIS